MRNSSTLAAFALVSVVACATTSTRTPSGVVSPESARVAAPPATSDLVGVWRVVRFCIVDSTGRETHPFGERPVGYFIYTPAGQLSIQVMRAPPVPPFAAGANAPTSTELLALHEGYFGYFGAYRITSDSTVTHDVAGGTIPSYIGTRQTRPFWIWGANRDSLSIGNRRERGCRLLVRAGS